MTRACETCGGDIETRGTRRRFCSERCRKAQYAGACEVCGAPTNGYNGPGKASRRCLEHAEPGLVQRERWLPRKQLLADLWHRGLTIPEIAAEMETSHNVVRKLAERMRRQGWDLPYAYDRRPSSIAKREREAA